MNGKILIGLNGLALLACIYLYQQYSLDEAFFVALYIVLTLFALSGISSMSFVKLMMFANICMTCLSTIVMVVLIVDGQESQAALPLPEALGLLLIIALLAVFNMKSLSKRNRPALF